MSELPPIAARHLAEHARGYLAELSRLSYQELARVQEPPRVSIAWGAAGVAYALWRAGHRLGRPELFGQAERWIQEAWRARGQPGAMAAPSMARSDWHASVAYGAAGLKLAACLIARSQGEKRDADRWRTRFRRDTEAATQAELLSGMAGFMAGWQILGRHGVGSRRDLVALTRRLAADRLTAAWRTGTTPLGMAHGLAGIHFALLQAAPRGRLPGWLSASLEQLGAMATRVGRGLRWPHDVEGRQNTLPGSWCNGSAGMALQWARAFEVTRHRGHLRLARHAALDAYDHVDPRPDLCCGSVGTAYAMLALSRADPGRGWQRKARRLATLALVTEARSAWPHGLLKGEGGLLCLSVDLLTGGTRLPLLED